MLGAAEQRLVWPEQRPAVTTGRQCGEATDQSGRDNQGRALHSARGTSRPMLSRQQEAFSSVVTDGTL